MRTARAEAAAVSSKAGGDSPMLLSKEDYRYVGKNALKRIAIEGKPYPSDNRTEKLVLLGEDSAYMREAVYERYYSSKTPDPKTPTEEDPNPPKDPVPCYDRAILEIEPSPYAMDLGGDPAGSAGEVVAGWDEHGSYNDKDKVDANTLDIRLLASATVDNLKEYKSVTDIIRNFEDDIADYAELRNGEISRVIKSLKAKYDAQKKQRDDAIEAQQDSMTENADRVDSALRSAIERLEQELDERLDAIDKDEKLTAAEKELKRFEAREENATDREEAYAEAWFSKREARRRFNKVRSEQWAVFKEEIDGAWNECYDACNAARKQYANSVKSRRQSTSDAIMEIVGGGNPLSITQWVYGDGHGLWWGDEYLGGWEPQAWELQASWEGMAARSGKIRNYLIKTAYFDIEFESYLPPLENGNASESEEDEKRRRVYTKATRGCIIHRPSSTEIAAFYEALHNMTAKVLYPSILRTACVFTYSDESGSFTQNIEDGSAINDINGAGQSQTTNTAGEVVHSGHYNYTYDSRTFFFTYGDESQQEAIDKVYVTVFIVASESLSERAWSESDYEWKTTVNKEAYAVYGVRVEAVNKGLVVVDGQRNIKRIRWEFSVPSINLPNNLQPSGDDYRHDASAVVAMWSARADITFKWRSGIDEP